ncbi:hypothetical protein MYX64_04525 [Nitrospinae bacterium AH_259_B05_G02_I21]|nr:hypothetical protein [Nitrospinae bacterium AH_259_B05_G02_I21]
MIGGFWFLLSLIAYIQHRQKKRWWAFLVSLMCFYLAVFSSQATIGLVAICLLYDMIYPPSGWSLGRAVASSCLRLTAFLPAIGLAVAIALHRGNLVKRYFLSFISPVKNVITILSHPWYSFGPQGVTDLYRQSPSALALVRNLLEAPNSGAIVALLLCAAGTGALFVWRGLRGTPLERFGCLSFLLAFIPFYLYSTVDKRLFYIPMMGFSLLIACWVLQLWRWTGPAVSPLPRGRTAVRFTVILLLVGWVIYQVSFVRQMGREYRTAGEIFSQVIQTLDQLAPFGRDGHLFLKGLPTAHGHTYIFTPYPDDLQEFLRIRWRNPTLRVHWLDQAAAFPRPFQGARFLIYWNQQLVEVDPSRECSGPSDEPGGNCPEPGSG